MVFFSEYRAVFEIVLKNTAEPNTLQMTMWCMLDI